MAHMGATAYDLLLMHYDRVYFMVILDVIPANSLAFGETGHSDIEISKNMK